MSAGEGERGFTLVEVMVAVVLLLVGVLGVATMVNGANAQTAVTKSREGATNLAREVLDAARSVDYDSALTPTAIVPALQAEPGLADADAGTAGWQINRRGVVYKIASTPVCIVDGAADGYGAHPAGDAAAPSYCSDATATGSQDPNPDDFRRVDVTITWSAENHNYSLRETTLIINPSGGIGPTVKSLCLLPPTTPTAATCPATAESSTVTAATTTSMNFLALTAAADTTEWTVDDGSQATDVSSSNSSARAGTAWNFAWPLGSPVDASTWACGDNINWTLDGNYIVSAQAITGIGANVVPGPVTPLTVTVNREKPYEVCGTAGGFDNHAQDTNDSRPAAVDVEWQGNPERDVLGYRLYRVGDSGDTLVCDTSTITTYPHSSSGCVCTSQTACLDTNPQGTTSVVNYKVVALDRDSLTGGIRESPRWAVIPADQDPSHNQAPPDFAAGSVTVTTQDGLPVISWPAVTDPDGDPILFYRVYRNGVAYTDRYDRVDGGTLSYTDNSPPASGATYYVTAVDSHYDESTPTLAVSP